MSDVIPYSNLAEDPTTEAVIYWIDERDAADGGSQTLHYGEEGGELTESLTDDDPDEVPIVDDTYLYVAFPDDLNPNTYYEAEIRDSDDNVLETCAWETLPESLTDREIRISVTSDWHTNIDDYDDSGRDEFLREPEMVDVIWKKKPDVQLFAGDYFTNGSEETETTVDAWLRLFREYYSRYDDEKLIHILAVPGNHEVGNDNWGGTTSESVDPEVGYFQFFYGHPRELEPVGENYGQITIGDYFQVLALDTHSAYPEDVGEFVENNIDESVLFCLPIQHEGFVQLGDRDDNGLTDNIRDAWFSTLYEADNVHFWQHGHVHTEGRTVPLKIVEEEPAGQYFELDGEYIVEADSQSDDILGLGEGWPDNRDLRNEWYIDRVQQQQNFSIVTLSNPSVRVDIYDDSGDAIDTLQFPDNRVATIGDATIGDVTFGGA